LLVSLGCIYSVTMVLIKGELTMWQGGQDNISRDKLDGYASPRMCCVHEDACYVWHRNVHKITISSKTLVMKVLDNPAFTVLLK